MFMKYWDGLLLVGVLVGLIEGADVGILDGVEVGLIVCFVILGLPEGKLML